MTGVPVTYRGCVNAWDCDQWGHQNVELYLARAGDAQAALCCELGLAPTWLRERGAAVLPRRERVFFRRELRAGDPICMRSGVRGLDAAVIRYFSVLTNQETGNVSAAFESEARLVDLGTLEPIELPTNVVARAAELAPASVAHPPPAPLEGRRAPDVTPEQTILTQRGSIASWECDETGLMPPRYQIGRFGGAATKLIQHLGLTKSEMLSRNLGSAALEYAIEYRVPLRPGQTVDIRSGVLDMKGKVFRCFHHLIDAQGAVATSIEVVIVFFDLVARKSVPMPEEIAARAHELMV